MKNLIIAIALSMTSSSVFANQSTSDVLGYTIAELIVTTAIPVVSSQATSITISEARKLEAQKIQNEVQEFNATGAMSLYLANKIALVKTVDAELSTSDSVDLLLTATNIILAE